MAIRHVGQDFRNEFEQRWVAKVISNLERNMLIDELRMML
jgi:hypothetical protein